MGDEAPFQCCNLDERNFCPNCRMSWYGSNYRCPACGNANTVCCYQTEHEARAYGRPLGAKDIVKVI